MTCKCAMRRLNAGFCTVVCLTLVMSLLGCNRIHEAQGAPKQDTSIEISIADFENGKWGADRISKEIENQFGVRIVPREYTMSNWISMVNFWANQDMLPDIFCTMGIDDNAAYHRYLSTGAIREIPMDMLMSRPHIKTLLDNNPVYKEFIVNGKLYAIPHTFWMKQEDDFKGQVAWCRKDWREALGIPPPKTLEEWTAMMDAFANSDPDGNGKKDTYGISYFEQPVPHFMYIALGAYVEDWVQEDGKWIHGACSKEAATAVAYCRDLYRRGILNPAYSTQKELKQTLDTFVQGDTGITAYGSMPDEVEKIYVYFGKTNPDKDPFACIEVLPFPEGPDEKIRNRTAFNWWSSISFSSKVSDEKLEKILDIFEWTLTPEGETMMLYGFEGEDYVLKDGKPVNLLGKNIDGTTRIAADKYPTARLGYYFNQKATQRMEGTLADERYLAISQNIKEMCDGIGLEHEINLKAKYWVSLDKMKINFSDMYYAYADTLILSDENKDIAQSLQQFWKGVYAQEGIENISEELTAYMAE